MWTVSGMVVSVVAAGLIGWRLPTALARRDRAADNIDLTSQVATLHGGLSDVSDQTDNLRASVDAISTSNDDLAKKIDGQHSKMSSLSKQISRLQKEIEALEG
jgi:peptidoglycan hydrolase CwlO-like protein